IIVPTLIWGPLPAIGTYLAVWALAGVCLALVFAPAHMGLPIVTRPAHDWQHQVETTRDLQLPRAVSYFFVGLDYQVEHHLFPKIPHQNLPLAAEITREWCQQKNVDHQAVPYVTALASSARFIASAWQRDAA